MLKYVKRLLAKLIASKLSAVCLKSVLHKTRYPKAAVIVNFHRFYDDNVDFIQKGPSVQTKINTFEKLITLLTDRYHVISMQNLVNHLSNNIPLEYDSVVITMDDGYLDNFTLALPVLTRYSIPATIYISTAYIGTSNRLPMDMIDYVLRSTKKSKFHWDKLGDGECRLVSADELRKANILIGKYIKGLSPSEAPVAIKELFEILDVDVSFNDRIMLNWDEVNKLSQSGIEIGSHAVTHYSLNKMPLSMGIKELAESKEVIENKINKKVENFAYPYGMEEDFNNQLRCEAKKAGYKSIVSVRRGINIPGATDPYDMSRVGLIGEPEETMLYIEKLFYKNLKLYNNTPDRY